MIETRIGDWIEVYSGNKFYPLDPRPNEIWLDDIAHGSSMMCRFNGQCSEFLSIGQHCINVSKEVAFLTRNWSHKKSFKAQALALLHDASEVLGIADICSPAKKHMKEYQIIEKRIQDAVWVAFGLEHTQEEYEIVDKVDKAMAAYEAKYLMPCKHWDINSSYLVTRDQALNKHIDLSFRNMKEVEEEFHGLALYLLSEIA